ncbi:alpha-amylase family glycosyl hydrolase [Alterisphingorhabdus coralli]|uniref:Alpha-amylase family glycosyl hydrolase n=1 Tax=Alterisphingorhabdus coralli TaxID=3071408 RepID=A0AA97I218_9SPHN|nr:alpha-amylase family glycosyl hydrolase [Parasphingorhabdus sp. SCSIO 66989]WOE76712.1 alpha-amylase family glycosyl hydrolase [Parasphingorhabdus sp. SCSIO 66989]
MADDPLAAEIAAQPWWRGASIYQIYPRSFMDSNGDGIGDLPGITSHLGHVADLGADAIWISPFFTSPMLDFGYDVAAFRDVDPIFGTLDDFDALVARAHGLGLKVIIDQVYSHSSDLHRWFTESRSSRDNDKADWYVWADAKSDGTPPNNWQSIFSGPAWSWDARRGQYYFHNFLPQQPDLNLHNPEVQEELLNVGRFWLDRGVNGFRIDAVLHMMHNQALTDNPPNNDPHRLRARSHDFQQNIHNQAQPEVLDFLARVRKMTDEYGAVFTVAEVGGSADAGPFLQACADGKRVNSAYGFDFLYASALTPSLVCDTQSRWKEGPGHGWPSWAFENHDAPRALSRWAQGHDHKAFATMKMALLTALRGSIILYQGEELGLDQVDIPFELVQDPEALKNWPLTLSRDGARTPLPWQGNAAHGGFTEGEPWLPLGEEHRALAIDVQEGDPQSLLEITRQLLTMRREHPTLRFGSARCSHRDDKVLTMIRQSEQQTLCCIFNMSDEEQAVGTLPCDAEADIVFTANGATREVLPPFGVIFLAC